MERWHTVHRIRQSVLGEGVNVWGSPKRTSCRIVSKRWSRLFENLMSWFSWKMKSIVFRSNSHFLVTSWTHKLRLWPKQWTWGFSFLTKACKPFRIPLMFDAPCIIGLANTIYDHLISTSSKTPNTVSTFTSGNCTKPSAVSCMVYSVSTQRITVHICSLCDMSVAISAMREIPCQCLISANRCRNIVWPIKTISSLSHSLSPGRYILFFLATASSLNLNSCAWSKRSWYSFLRSKCDDQGRSQALYTFLLGFFL
jgi:hypothetical protein